MTLGAYCDLFHNKSKLAVVPIACAAAQQESAEILLRRVSSSRRTTFKNFRARCEWSRRATTTAHLLLVTDRSPYARIASPSKSSLPLDIEGE